MSNQLVLDNSQMIVEAELSIPGFTVRVASWNWTQLLEYEWYPPFYNIALLLADSFRDAGGPFRTEPPLGSRRPMGSLIFTPADTCLPVLAPPGGIRCVTAEFDRDWFEKITGFGRHRQPEMLSPILNMKHPQLTQSLLSLAGEALAPGRASRKFAEGVAMQTAIYAARYLEKTYSKAKSASQGLSPWQMRRITSHIENMPGYAPDIIEVAGLCGIGDRHLRRLFKQTTGQTISEYSRDVWVAKVKWLLGNTALALKQIAARTGFADPSSFAAAFRRASGVTPKEFRQQVRRNLTH
jgi:AraC family transcriptional regulator